MKERFKKEFEFQRLASEEYLPQEEKSLLLQAAEAMSGSYSPYSKFRVGAAVLLSNGHVELGANQENAAYPSGLCAERVAIFSAMSKFPKLDVVKIAIKAKSSDFDVNTAVAPCGACRQVLLEYELKQDKPIQLILQGESGEVLIINSTKELLPFYFHETKLKKD